MKCKECHQETFTDSLVCAVCFMYLSLLGSTFREASLYPINFTRRINDQPRQINVDIYYQGN